jgi:hypothetical protein
MYSRRMIARAAGVSPATLKVWVARGQVPWVPAHERTPGKVGRQLSKQDAEIVAVFAVVADEWGPRWAKDVVEAQISHGRKMPDKFTVYRDKGGIIYGTNHPAHAIYSSTTFHVDYIRERLAEEAGP